MKRVWLALSIVAVGLGGCLNMKSGPNPSCAPASLSGAGAVEICRIGGLVFVEPLGDAPSVPLAEPVAEPSVVTASGPETEEVAPAATEDFNDGEPMVITSEAPQSAVPGPRLPPQRPADQIAF